LLRLKLRPLPVMGAMIGGLLAADACGLYWRVAIPAVPFLAVAGWLLVGGTVNVCARISV
jgi:hypothetical protein